SMTAPCPARWRRPPPRASGARRSAPSCSTRSRRSPAGSASGSTSTSPAAMSTWRRRSHDHGPNGPRCVPSPSLPARRRVVVCGDVINDVLVKPYDGVTPDSDTRAAILVRPGGSAANQAAWMAHLGADVVFAGRVGARDAAYHRRELAHAGVRARLAADREAETGSIVIMVAPDGGRTMFTDRGAAPDRVHVLRAVPARGGALAARPGPGPGARGHHRPGFRRLPGPDGTGRVPALDRGRRDLLPQPRRGRRTHRRVGSTRHGGPADQALRCRGGQARRRGLPAGR